ncbi:hypothetical protein SEA_NICEHOUSE_263 [Rhodococcus phage NiceHouse]|nr:hypothetical protein SEA_NICEHOUSE_263 [Rhodococcus phage NiceHouse]
MMNEAFAGGILMGILLSVFVWVVWSMINGKW